MNKKELEKLLSTLKVFEDPSLKLEQYPTPSHIAADVLWIAFMNGDIENNVIADLGAGTGILGIGALMLGAEHVHFVEIDENAIEVLEDNLKSFGLDNYKIHLMDVNDFDLKVDTVLTNPPFGTKTKHADKLFLEKAFDIAKVIYSFHKSETKVFIDAIAKDHAFKPIFVYHYDFPLRKTQEFHEKAVKNIDVDCYRFTFFS